MNTFHSGSSGEFPASAAERPEILAHRVARRHRARQDVKVPLPRHHLLRKPFRQGTRIRDSSAAPRDSIAFDAVIRRRHSRVLRWSRSVAGERDVVPPCRSPRSGRLVRSVGEVLDRADQAPLVPRNPFPRLVLVPATGTVSRPRLVPWGGLTTVRSGVATSVEIGVRIGQPRGRRLLLKQVWDYCDLSVEDTAGILGCSTGTVKSRTARGLGALRASAAERTTN